MAIPNVTVNIKETSFINSNVDLPFVPAVLLKTKSGPIGTTEFISSESEFIEKFGQSDATTRAAFTLQKYLRLYNYAYVTRIANTSETSIGNATVTFDSEEEKESTLANFAPQSADYLGKLVSELVEAGGKILESGNVKANFKYVTGYTGFSGDVEEQSGYYFPFVLTTTGTNMTIKKNGVITKEDVAFDPELLFRITQNDTFEVLVDGESYITLTFTASNFENSSSAIVTSNTINLFKVETDYSTDLYNGDLVSLKYDANTSKVYIDLSELVGRPLTTIKEDISIGTLKAAIRDESGALIGGLEYILNKLVNSANAISGLPVTLTNLFVDKTDTDEVPTSGDFENGFSAYIQNGNSGNTTDVNVANVKALIDLYDYENTPIDIMVIPEYRQYEVVNYAVTRGRQNFYRVIAQATGTDIDSMKNSISNYIQDELGYLEVYANDVYFSDMIDENGNNLACPISVAVLNAYGNANRQNKWCTIAGVNRGLLTQISGLEVKMTKPDMDNLYDSTIPINTVLYLSGRGYAVWGNKTTANAETVKLFDRVNVARLVNYLHKELIQSSWEYLFEPITLYLMTEFKNGLVNICQALKDGSGISAYIILCDDSNNTEETIAKNELHAQIKIQPTEALEYIIIDLDVADTITIGVEEE